MPTFSELADLIEKGTGRSPLPRDLEVVKWKCVEEVCEIQTFSPFGVDAKSSPSLRVYPTLNPEYVTYCEKWWKRAAAVWHELDWIYRAKLKVGDVELWANIGYKLRVGPDFPSNGSSIEPHFCAAELEFLRSLDSVVADGGPGAAGQLANLTDPVPRTKRRAKRAAGGRQLKPAARRDLVLTYIGEHHWEGTYRELSAALLRDKGLPISPATLSRYLKGTQITGAPRRALARRGEREAVDTAEPGKWATREAYTIPDDPDD